MCRFSVSVRAAPIQICKTRALCYSQGWRVDFAGAFLNDLDAGAREEILSRDWKNEDGVVTSDGLGAPQAIGWRGAVVAVLGLYDKGKTFVLNQLTESKLPSGKKVATKGLSFKHVEVEGGTRFVLLDSEGSYSPVKVSNELSVVEKEATELFLQVRWAPGHPHLTHSSSPPLLSPHSSPLTSPLLSTPLTTTPRLFTTS